MPLITLKKWCEKNGVGLSTLKSRLYKSGIHHKSNAKVAAKKYAYLYEESQLDKLKHSTMGRPVMKKQLAQALFIQDSGKTAADLAKICGFDIKKTDHYPALKAMCEKGDVEKVDTLYFITDAGIVSYGLRSALNQPSKKPVKAAPIVDPPVLLVEDFETRLPETEVETPKRSTESLLEWGVWEALDDAGKKIICNYENSQRQPRQVDNLEMKIELLNELAEQFNPQISNKLKMIIEDLQA